jgi:hypothetical protein
VRIDVGFVGERSKYRYTCSGSRSGKMEILVVATIKKIIREKVMLKVGRIMIAIIMTMTTEIEMIATIVMCTIALTTIIATGM